MTARSEAWLCGRSFAGFVGSIPAGSVDVCLLWVFHVVSASGRSLVQRIPTDCGVSECDREASIMRKPWPTAGCVPWENELCLRLLQLQSGR